MRKEIWIILVCTILLVITMGGGLYWMTSHLEELRSNPLVYSAQLLSEEAGSDLYCSCHYDSPRIASFNFDKHNITYPQRDLRDLRNAPLFDFNVSEVLGNLTVLP